MRCLFISWFLFAMAFASACHAQSLQVTNAPFAPGSAGREAGAQFIEPIGAFRLAASGGAVTVNGITLTVTGSGNWATELSPGTGVQLRVDNGDQSFVAADDSIASQGSGSQPTVVLTMTPSLVIASGTSVDFWLVLNVSSTAGASQPHTFQASIANATDVVVSGPATVTLGAPAPNSSTLTIVIFYVSSFVPQQSGPNNPIVIDGSGFTVPVTLTIDGIVCTGTPTINGAGTQITGFLTPDVGNHALTDITLSTGVLGPRLLTQKFSGAGGDSGRTGPSCSTSESNIAPASSALAVCLVVLFVQSFRKLRRRSLVRRNQHEA